MGADHNALLEVMEQQSISVAKAGVVCNLAARTSVIAAANPVGGHYNRGKTVAENIKLNTALLSRFDLIFILLDRPDSARDKMLSEHVIAMHCGHERLPSTPRLSASASSDMKVSVSQWQAEVCSNLVSTHETVFILVCSNNPWRRD